MVRNRILIIATAGLIAAGASACDANSGPTANPSGDGRQVTVVGNGEVQGTPDTLTANVGIEFIAPDVTGAVDQSSQRQQAVIDAVVGTGVDRKDISTTQVSVQPQFTDGTITGYRAANTIDIRIRDTARASELLALIATTGADATRINSVHYSIEDDSALMRDARSRAFEDARSRAEQYAELSGLSLGQVISISEQTEGAMPPRPMPRAAMQAVPVEPGQQTVDFSVTVVWELT